MSLNWGKLGPFIVKGLQLAVIADQAFAETQQPGANASSVLQPNNFDNLLNEIAIVVSPPVPATAAPAAPAPAAPVGLVPATAGVITGRSSTPTVGDILNNRT